jgi:choline dehydrogenase
MSVMQPPSADEPARATILVFDVKPLSSGTLALRSTAPADVPLIRRGFLSEAADVGAIVDGIGLARELATTTPLDELLGAEILPASRPLEEYVRSTVRNYFHPAATCAMGTVVDERGHVHGIEGLVVADASIMPTIPRANTNLTTAAIAERIAETLRG